MTRDSPPRSSAAATCPSRDALIRFRGRSGSGFSRTPIRLDLLPDLGVREFPLTHRRRDPLPQSGTLRSAESLPNGPTVGSLCAGSRLVVPCEPHTAPPDIQRVVGLKDASPLRDQASPRRIGAPPHFRSSRSFDRRARSR